MPKTVAVNLWDGRVLEVREITMFAEKDQYDNVFYKIQGKNGTQEFMISYFRNMEKAMSVHNDLLIKILVAQTEVLSA